MSCSIFVAIVLRKARGFGDQTGERPRVEAEREREKDYACVSAMCQGRAPPGLELLAAASLRGRSEDGPENHVFSLIFCVTAAEQASPSGLLYFPLAFPSLQMA